MVKQAAIAGLLSVGCTPVDVGIVPVPALMFHVREAGAFGGISVSGEPWLARVERPQVHRTPKDWPFAPTRRPSSPTSIIRALPPGAGPGHVRRSRRCDDHRAPPPRRRRSAVDVERIRARRFRVAVDPRGGAAIDSHAAAARGPGLRRGRHRRGRRRAVLRQTLSRRRRTWRSSASSCAARERTSASPRTRMRTGSPSSTSTAPRSART